MRYVWHRGAWAEKKPKARVKWPPPAPRRRRWNFVENRFATRADLKRWAAIRREALLLARRDEALREERQRAIAASWQAYDRSVGAWIGAHVDSESGYVPGVFPVEGGPLRLYDTYRGADGRLRVLARHLPAPEEAA